MKNAAQIGTRVFSIIGFTLGFQLASTGMAAGSLTGIKATAVAGISFSVFGGTIVGLIGYLLVRYSLILPG